MVVTYRCNRNGNLPDEGDCLTTHQRELNHDSNHSIIHHFEKNHHSQALNISQELYSYRERIFSYLPKKRTPE